MLCQWSATYCLGDDPARSAQHECRFPTIIQLDEVAPPPPSSQKASLSPVPSSSQSYDYYSSSEDCEGGDEEEEEATESYCSSDSSCPEFGVGDSERGPVTTSAPVEQKAKMSRVLAWRNSFDSVFAEDNAAALLSLKRKYSNEPEGGENGGIESQQDSSDAASTSQAPSRSKRSRTHSVSSSLASPPPQVPPPSPGHAHTHICSACDASFLSLEELQHHSESDHEACRIAVQYGFE